MSPDHDRQMQLIQPHPELREMLTKLRSVQAPSTLEDLFQRSDNFDKFLALAESLGVLDGRFRADIEAERSDTAGQIGAAILPPATQAGPTLTYAAGQLPKVVTRAGVLYAAMSTPDGKTVYGTITPVDVAAVTLGGQPAPPVTTEPPVATAPPTNPAPTNPPAGPTPPAPSSLPVNPAP